MASWILSLLPAVPSGLPHGSCTSPNCLNAAHTVRHLASAFASPSTELYGQASRCCRCLGTLCFAFNIALCAALLALLRRVFLLPPSCLVRPLLTKPPVPPGKAGYPSHCLHKHFSSSPFLILYSNHFVVCVFFFKHPFCWLFDLFWHPFMSY